MSVIRKNLIIPALLVVFIITGIMFSKVYAGKDDQLFTIEDIQGDRSAIADVKISGELSDGFHRTRFSIDGEKIKLATDLYELPKVVSQNNGIAQRLTKDGLYYQVENWAYGKFDIIVSDEIDHRIISNASVWPRISNQSSQYTLTNIPEYGVARVGDKSYFTVPTTKDWTGTNGIYELDFDPRDKDSSYQDPDQSAITTFDLDRNKEQDGSSIEVLGLEAIGDKLALLVVENNQLIVRGFDSQSGKELGEAVIDDFVIAGVAGNGNSPLSESYFGAYKAYSDDDTGILNLSFQSSLSSKSDDRKTIWSVDFSNGVKVINKVATRITDGQDDAFPTKTDISYRNDKLYVVKVLNEKSETNLIYNQILPPKRFMIYVYQKAALLYKGELVTELNDDLIKTINIPTSVGMSYVEADYRTFRNIEIE